MTNQLYSVTLTDLGSYRTTVAAHSIDEAKTIATTVLFEEATTLPNGMTIIKREAEALVEPAHDVPIRLFRVDATYRLDFALTVPAASRAEAEVHARRLYDANCGPYEFEVGNEQVGPFRAVEVLS